MSGKTWNILFLCTANSARSILAESVLRKKNKGHFRAFSAGSEPRGEVNPLALAALEEAAYPTEGLRSKSWLEFSSPGAPEMDVVITVCDNAAGETCPVWPGRPVRVHWGIEDPARAQGTEAEKQAAFRQALHYIEQRIEQLAALLLDRIGAASLETRLQEIGRSPGASPGASQSLNRR